MDRTGSRFGAPIWAAAALLMTACQGIDMSRPEPEGAEPGERRVVVPPPTEAELAAFRAELEPLMRRQPIAMRTRANGVVVHDLGDSFQNVALARIDADGNPNIECVESVAEAEAFLRSTPEADDR